MQDTEATMITSRRVSRLRVAEMAHLVDLVVDGESFSMNVSVFGRYASGW